MSAPTRHIVGTVVWLVLAAGGSLFAVPYLMTGWQASQWITGYPVLRLAGAVVLSASVLTIGNLYLRSIREGEGTPAPYYPTRFLLVSGLYHHVRNPIYLAVVAAVLGEALYLGRVALLAYAALLWLGLHLYVVRVEEPRLRDRFGDPYADYCRTVRRWAPR